METAAWSLFWGVIGSLLGSLATVGFLAIRTYVAARRGEFTGTWQQTIPAFEGEPEKIATVTLKHIGDKLVGTTERTSPRTEFVQRWIVEGRIKRGLIFGIYWPEDSAKLPGSYGTLQFKIVDENRFDGFYVRARPLPGEGGAEFVETLKTIPLTWDRLFEDGSPPATAEAMR